MGRIPEVGMVRTSPSASARPWPTRTLSNQRSILPT